MRLAIGNQETIWTRRKKAAEDRTRTDDLLFTKQLLSTALGSDVKDLKITAIAKDFSLQTIMSGPVPGRRCQFVYRR
jgi:hypothetical protein